MGELSIKYRVKKLLQSGKSQIVIAQQLSLSRGRVNKLKKEIIQDKINWNKKKSDLQSQACFIRQCLLEEMSTREIHLQLQKMNVSSSYSTVAKFVAPLKKQHKQKAVVPGQEAKVFLIYTGKFVVQDKKVAAWIFIMKLSYSKYSFHKLSTRKDVETFLKCHREAFEFFKGVPHSIRVNKTKAFNFNDPLINKKYSQFLKKAGSTLLPKSNRNCSVNYHSCVRRFKELFLFHVLHKDAGRLSRELKKWNAVINLGIHPVTKKIIQKEFDQNERPLLLPVQTHPFKNLKYDRQTNTATGKKTKPGRAKRPEHR